MGANSYIMKVINLFVELDSDCYIGEEILEVVQKEERGERT